MDVDWVGCTIDGQLTTTYFNFLVRNSIAQKSNNWQLLGVVY